MSYEFERCKEIALAVDDHAGIRLEKTLAFSVEEYRARVEGVRASLAAQSLDGLLTTFPENVTYLSGFQSPGYYKTLAMIVPAVGDPLIVLRGFELPNVEVWSWFDDALGIGEGEDPMQVVAAGLGRRDLIGKRVGIEHNSWFLTLAELEQLRHRAGATEFVDASGTVEALRTIKSAAEIDYVRQGCVVAEAMIQAGYDAIAEGATENDVAAAVLAAMAKGGGHIAGLPPFICSGDRSGHPHATWAGRRLEVADPVLFETAGVIMRYTGPLMRTAFVKEVRPEHERVAEASLAGLEAALAAVRPGVTGAEVDAAMHAVFREAGLADAGTHRAGYSVGLNWPPDWGEGYLYDLSPHEQRPLRPGMTLHIPGPQLFVPPYSVGISETVVVTDDGYECLTRFPRTFPVLG
jgi:Xaa-Pro dipeptidase